MAVPASDAAGLLVRSGPCDRQTIAIAKSQIENAISETTFRLDSCAAQMSAFPIWNGR